MEAVRIVLARNSRGLFYGLVGLLILFVTTPALGGVPWGASIAQSAALLPVVGLLAYLIHLFEELGRSSPSTGTGTRTGRTDAGAGAGA